MMLYDMVLTVLRLLMCHISSKDQARDQSMEFITSVEFTDLQLPITLLRHFHLQRFGPHKFTGTYCKSEPIGGHFPSNEK